MKEKLLIILLISSSLLLAFGLLPCVQNSDGWCDSSQYLVYASIAGITISILGSMALGMSRSRKIVGVILLAVLCLGILMSVYPINPASDLFSDLMFGGQW